jgi:hypothetical protein
MVELRTQQSVSHHEGKHRLGEKHMPDSIYCLGFAGDFLFGGGVILWSGWVEKIGLRPGRWKTLSSAP